MPLQLYCPVSGLSVAGNDARHGHAAVQRVATTRAPPKNSVPSAALLSGQKHDTQTADAICRNSSSFQSLREFSDTREEKDKWSRGDSNPRPVTKNAGKTDPCERGAPLCAPPVAQPNTDNLQLTELINAWSSLPTTIQRGIMAMVEEMRKE